MSMLDCWTLLSSCLPRTLHMGKLRINPSHVTMCSVTCEIYSVAIVIVTQDEGRDHQRPHYIVKSVNQLENQSEVWPQSCQESMERNYNDRITQQTKSHCDLDHDIVWTTCVCSFEMDHMTMCVFGVIRKLQLWFITLCIILHILAQQQGHRPGDHPTRGVIIITVLGTQEYFANITPGHPDIKTICEYSLIQSPVDFLLSKPSGSCLLPSSPTYLSGGRYRQILSNSKLNDLFTLNRI